MLLPSIRTLYVKAFGLYLDQTSDKTGQFVFLSKTLFAADIALYFCFVRRLKGSVNLPQVFVGLSLCKDYQICIHLNFKLHNRLGTKILWEGLKIILVG